MERIDKVFIYMRKYEVNIMRIKFTAILLSIITLTLYFSIGVFAVNSAVNSNDSLEINSDEAAKFKNDSSDTVIKIYNGSFMHGFADKVTIDKLISSDYVLEPFYMVISKTEGRVCKAERNGAIISVNMSDWNKLYKTTISPQKVLQTVSSEITVKNTYCLDGEPSHDGVYLYFVTDKGDYVYYKEYVSAENEYLFPVEKFYDFAKAVYTERQEYNKIGTAGGIPPIEEIFDLKAYKIRSTNSTLSVILWTASIVILIAFVSRLFAIKKHTKKA
jgi:hypothetical protein